jgi:ubiquinone/menaquinone biosynthesis C-methylase UbiE
VFKEELMENIIQSRSEGTTELSYLELLAYLGITRHLGGWDANTELCQLCQIRPGKYVLDVGCGVGRTPCILAQRYGSRVVGVDLSPRMVEWSRQRAEHEGVAGTVEIRVADAQQLPFDDATFDAVITESVLAFVPDRAKALRELVRVTKPGGYVGLNEVSWLKIPIPQAVLEYLSGDTFSGARAETVETWRSLLAASGVQDVVVRIHQISARSDVRDRLKWFGFRGAIANLCRMATLSLSSPATRRGLWRLTAMSRHGPKDLYDYYGYGIYVGKK